MQKRSFGVSVESIAYTNRELYIGSRILLGSLAVGDVFTELGTSFHETNGVTNGTDVELRVTQILTYGQLVSCINAGMTCEIKLAFDKPPRIGPRDYLAGASDDSLPQLETLGTAEQNVPTI